MTRPGAKKASGALFGMAFGDALAAPVEFVRSAEEIRRAYPPDGPRELEGNPARVTDDTQMALAVCEALADSPRPLTPAGIEPPLRTAFVRWLNSPDNNRAPGNTCLEACENLERGRSWWEATVPGSKGCGANMRVAPVGLLSLCDEAANGASLTRAALAQFQAALTHGDPTALAASDLTAAAVAALTMDVEPSKLLDFLREYARANRSVYHEEWLGPLWQRPGIASPAEFIERGWDECDAALERVSAGLERAAPADDPCEWTGDGWVAEEALATALFCFLPSPGDPIAVVRRAAVTRGDSDSIACIAGAFAGAYCGLDAWPADWVRRIEYADALARFGTLWDRSPRTTDSDGRQVK